jgi:hypothetical protein
MGGLEMVKVEDVWQPETRTEHEILKNMESEREFRLRMLGSHEVKEIKVAYHNYKQFGPFHGSDLDLELLLEYVRATVEVFENKVQDSGRPYLDFSKGVMDACHGFLHQIICLHEAKKKLRRDALDETKLEIQDRERESKLI